MGISSLGFCFFVFSLFPTLPWVLLWIYLSDYTSWWYGKKKLDSLLSTTCLHVFHYLFKGLFLSTSRHRSLQNRLQLFLPKAYLFTCVSLHLSHHSKIYVCSICLVLLSISWILALYFDYILLWYIYNFIFIIWILTFILLFLLLVSFLSKASIIELQNYYKTQLNDLWKL